MTNYYYILANGMMNYGTTTTKGNLALAHYPSASCLSACLSSCPAVFLSDLTWTNCDFSLCQASDTPTHRQSHTHTHTFLYHVSHKARVSNTEVSMHTFCSYALLFLVYFVYECVCVLYMCDWVCLASTNLRMYLFRSQSVRA